MASLVHLVAFVAAHSRMAQLARAGRAWQSIEAEADHWADLLANTGSWGSQLRLPGIPPRWWWDGGSMR
jgi:hypothetical protein